MDFGLALRNYDDEKSVEALEASATTAEALGWRSVYAVDHLLVARGGKPDYRVTREPLLSLASIGARPHRLRIAIGVLVPAGRDAVQLAKELATLDVLSGGRLVACVGSGDELARGECMNLGKHDHSSARGAYLDETIALWRHLWSGSQDPFEGRCPRLADYAFGPLPVQRERLPI